LAESPTPTPETVVHEIAMIAYYCGWSSPTGRGPTLDEVPEIVRVCVSVGPRGWGLALLALNLMLSGGAIPFYAVMPVPRAYLGRVTRMCVLEEGNLPKGDFKSRDFFSAGGSFGFVVEYRDLGNVVNSRCFIVRKTAISNYPFMAEIPPDDVCREMTDVCRSEIPEYEPAPLPRPRPQEQAPLIRSPEVEVVLPQKGSPLPEGSEDEGEAEEGGDEPA